jgi:uncharacterized repeat protein (TIGR02059 family)
VITVAYTKPASNPIQTPSGGKAATLSATSVTNGVVLQIPAYVSSVISDAAPTQISLTFDQSLVNTVPAASAFTVMVNSVARTVNTVSVSGTTVTLVLSSAALNGDVVTVAYTQPGSNQLQNAAGGMVLSFSAKSVNNNVGVANLPPVISVVSPDTVSSGFVGEIDASGSSDPNGDIITFAWTPDAGIDISSASDSKIRFLAPILPAAQTVNFVLNVSDGKVITSKTVSVVITPYNPGLNLSLESEVAASGFLGAFVASNAADNDTSTFWMSDGDNQWLLYKLSSPFRIDHFKISFPTQDIGSTFFDMYASKDSLNWDQLITNATSSGFSNGLQVFKSTGSGLNAYSFVKFVGHGNTLNTLDKVSEMQVYGGVLNQNTDLIEIGITVYPNPATEMINLIFDQSLNSSQTVRIVNSIGKLVYESTFNEGVSYLQIPVTFAHGIYVIQLITDGRILGAAKLIIQ